MGLQVVAQEAQGIRRTELGGRRESPAELLAAGPAEQFPVEVFPVEFGLPHCQGDRDGKQLGSLDSQWVDVCRQSRETGLLDNSVQVVAEEQADRSHAHGRPVAQRAPGELSTSQFPPILAAGHGLQHPAGSRPIAPAGVVIVHELSAEGLLDNPAVFQKGLRHSDHHLGVVGVTEGGAGRNLKQIASRSVSPKDHIGRHALEGRPEGVANGLPEKAPKESVPGTWGHHVFLLS